MTPEQALRGALVRCTSQKFSGGKFVLVTLAGTSKSRAVGVVVSHPLSMREARVQISLGQDFFYRCACG